VIEVRSPGGKSNPNSPPPPPTAVAATAVVNFGLPTVTDGKSPALKHTKQLFQKTLQQIHVIKAFEGNHLNYDTLSITVEFVPNGGTKTRLDRGWEALDLSVYANRANSVRVLMERHHCAFFKTRPTSSTEKPLSHAFQLRDLEPPYRLFATRISRGVVEHQLAEIVVLEKRENAQQHLRRMVVERSLRKTEGYRSKDSSAADPQYDDRSAQSDGYRQKLREAAQKRGELAGQEEPVEHWGFEFESKDKRDECMCTAGCLVLIVLVLVLYGYLGE
jgi:hypothetical protein